MISVDIKKLHLFITLADTLSFRVTAERLHLSQPAVTRALVSLEAEVGVRLFHRDRRHVAITAEGASLLVRARKLVVEMDDFAFAAHSLAASTQETLRIGLYGNGLADLTDIVIGEYCRQYPDVSVRVFETDFRHGIGPLLSGEYQAAFMRLPGPLPELRTVPLFQEPMDALLPADHRLASAPSIAVEELMGDPWVSFPGAFPDIWSGLWIASAHRAGNHPIIGAYARTEYELHAAVAYQGVVGLLPRSSLRLRAHPRVVAVPVRGYAPVAAGVALPAMAAGPAALALATVASEVARTSLHLVADAKPVPADGRN